MRKDEYSAHPSLGSYANLEAGQGSDRPIALVVSADNVPEAYAVVRLTCSHVR